MRDKVCGPLAYVVLASSETTARQQNIAVNGSKFKLSSKSHKQCSEQHQTSPTLETGSEHTFRDKTFKHLISLPDLPEKINKTHLSSYRLIVGKPYKLTSECSRIPQLNDHFCGTLLYSVIDSQGFPTTRRLLGW